MSSDSLECSFTSPLIYTFFQKALSLPWWKTLRGYQRQDCASNLEKWKQEKMIQFFQFLPETEPKFTFRAMCVFCFCFCLTSWMALYTDWKPSPPSIWWWWGGNEWWTQGWGTKCWTCLLNCWVCQFRGVLLAGMKSNLPSLRQNLW